MKIKAYVSQCPQVALDRLTRIVEAYNPQCPSMGAGFRAELLAALDGAKRALVELYQTEATATELLKALRMFERAAYPVSDTINARGYNWSEAYLDQALQVARATIAKAEKEEPSWLND